MFNGMIDGVTIVKEALTSDQIAAAYNAGAPEYQFYLTEVKRSPLILEGFLFYKYFFKYTIIY